MKGNSKVVFVRVLVPLVLVCAMLGLSSCASNGAESASEPASVTQPSEPGQATAPSGGKTVAVSCFGAELNLEEEAYLAFAAAMTDAGYQVTYNEGESTATVADPLRLSGYVNREQKVDSAVWQLSGEARACFIQSFNWAKIRLDEEIAQAQPGENLAIIADIDDTLVDGVMYTADVLQDGPWDDPAFGESLDSDQCLPLPGAVEFMSYAAEQGVEVFYITNRSSLHYDRTLAQLQKMGFPNADADHLFILQDGESSNKETRRNTVEENHKVVMLLGDNLADFSDDFRRELGVDGRRDAVDAAADSWGDLFIMLPNAVYGDWEGAVYANDKSLSAEQIMQAKRDLFDQYKYTR